MTAGAQALVAATVPALRDSQEFNPSGLRVFTSIPPRDHDVVALLGMVLVFDTAWRGGIVDGGLYVVERQIPVGGMGWETYDRLNREYAPDQQRVRIKTSRHVVRTVRLEIQPKHWWHVAPSGFCDGPYADWSVGNDIVGSIVGIYRPDETERTVGNSRRA